MMDWYREDLAYIHDVGFSDYALKSAPGILEILARNKIHGGLVVDLGCGGGRWAWELTEAGYRVLGIDISESMVEIARNRVPNAEFRVGSLFDTNIPSCDAVTSIGEVFSYLFDPENSSQNLDRLFLRIHDALTPGGVLIFDIAEPGQVRRSAPERSFSEGEDWMVMVEKQEDTQRSILTRRISSFRRVGEYYRRSDEVHRQRLYKSPEIADRLRLMGFRVRMMRGYGRYRLPRAHAAFVARKPA